MKIEKVFAGGILIALSITTLLNMIGTFTDESTSEEERFRDATGAAKDVLTVLGLAFSFFAAVDSIDREPEQKQVNAPIDRNAIRNQRNAFFLPRVSPHVSPNRSPLLRPVQNDEQPGEVRILIEEVEGRPARQMPVNPRMAPAPAPAPVQQNDIFNNVVILR